MCCLVDGGIRSLPIIRCPNLLLEWGCTGDMGGYAYDIALFIVSICLFVCLLVCRNFPSWWVSQGSGLMKVCGGFLSFFEFSTNFRRAFLAWPRLSMCEPCPVGATCRGGLAPPVSDPGAPLERFGFIREMVCNTWRNFLDDICRTNISESIGEMNGVVTEMRVLKLFPKYQWMKIGRHEFCPWISSRWYTIIAQRDFPRSGCHDFKKNCKTGGNVDSRRHFCERAMHWRGYWDAKLGRIFGKPNIFCRKTHVTCGCFHL